MKKSTKISLIVATACVVVGFLTATVSGAIIGFDFNLLNTSKMTDKTYTVTETFESINIEDVDAKIEFVLSENECKLECRQNEKVSYDIAVRDGVLTVKKIDNRKWYDHIGIYFESETMKVYLPESSFKELSVSTTVGNVGLSDEFAFENVSIKTNTGKIDVKAKISNALTLKSDTGKITVGDINPKNFKVETDTGNITINNLSADEISFESDTGNVVFGNVGCQSLSGETETGNIILNSVIADAKMSLVSDTGNIKFERCDAGEIYVVSDTGNVTGSLLSDKVFITETDTGNIQAPETLSGGKCKIKTDTGNIKIEIVK